MRLDDRAEGVDGRMPRPRSRADLSLGASHGAQLLNADQRDLLERSDHIRTDGSSDGRGTALVVEVQSPKEAQVEVVEGVNGRSDCIVPGDQRMERRPKMLGEQLRRLIAEQLELVDVPQVRQPCEQFRSIWPPIDVGRLDRQSQVRVVQDELTTVH
jgi:hypothetical protein